MLQAVPHAIGFVLPPVIVPSARMGGAWMFLPVGLAYVALQPVAAAHSWNSCHRLSNRVLINLARHSDHHLAAGYRVLRHLETALQLPAGYGAMLLLAMLPPIWRRVMDPRVIAWRARL